MILYHNNVNGFDSKTISINHIINVVLPSLSLAPSFLSFNETKSKYDKVVKVPGYKTFHLNRANKAGGGIASLVRESDKDSIVKVSEGLDDQEIISTRYAKYNPPINIMNIYNEVESHVSKDRVA